MIASCFGTRRQRNRMNLSKGYTAEGIHFQCKTSLPPKESLEWGFTQPPRKRNDSSNQTATVKKMSKK